MPKARPRMTGALRCLALVLTLALTWSAAALVPPARAGGASETPLLLILGPDGSRLASVDRAALDALPQVAFTTTTIWTNGPQEFAGVPLAVLLDHYGIEAARLDLAAANDYTVTLPAEGIGPVHPVIAHSRNGAPMSLRDKGPLWLVYDYDSDPQFQTETIYMRSIWQLDRITAHPPPG